MSIKRKPEKAGTGGSWVVVSGVIRRMTMTITHAMRLKTLLITTHEPPSTHGAPSKQGR